MQRKEAWLRLAAVEDSPQADRDGARERGECNKMKLKGPNGKIDGTRKVPDGIERKGEGVRLAIRQLVPSSGKTTREDSFA